MVNKFQLCHQYFSPFNNKLVINSQEKPNIFIDFFSKQCQPTSNNSTFPSTVTFRAISRRSTADIDSKKVLKLIWSLNSEKDRDHDGISINMLTTCGPSIIISLSFLLDNCLTYGVSPSN